MASTPHALAERTVTRAARIANALALIVPIVGVIAALIFQW